jgi:hypothetical protein
MKKKLFIIFIGVLLITLAGCTRNQMARKFGGNSKLELPSGQKLVNITWKNDNLWYLTRPMKESEIPETYMFSEDSNIGILEGSVTIVESK